MLIFKSDLSDYLRITNNYFTNIKSGENYTTFDSFIPSSSVKLLWLSLNIRSEGGKAEGNVSIWLYDKSISSNDVNSDRFENSLILL